MGINWRGAIRGAAEGVANVSQLMITDHVQQKRDANLARYQQQMQQEQFAQQDVMQMRDLTAKGVMQQQQIEAAEQQAIAERQNKLYDSETEYQRDRSLIELKGKVDPSGNVVNVNTGDNAFTSALDKADAAMYTKLREQAVSAGKAEATLKVLEEIGANTETGVTPEIMARIGTVFGTQAGASLQAYQAAVTPLILDQTSKLSGVISDKDMEVIKSSMPSFATDPRANKIILGIIRKGMEDAKQMYAEATNYLKNQSENYTLRGWEPSLSISMPPSEEAQSNIDAANDPMGTLSAFDQWKRSQSGM